MQFFYTAHTVWLNKLLKKNNNRCAYNKHTFKYLFQIQEANNEIHEVIENRMRNTNPIDDKLSLFRQQVSDQLYSFFCSRNIYFSLEFHICLNKIQICISGNIILTFAMFYCKTCILKFSCWSKAATQTIIFIGFNFVTQKRTSSRRTECHQSSINRAAVPTCSQEI